ncbi:hypothetical protein [Roseibium sp. M-1]
MMEVLSSTPGTANRMLDEISWVTAVCPSAAEEIPTAMSPKFLTMATMGSIAVTARPDVSYIEQI